MNDDDRELDEILAGDQGDGFDMMGAPVARARGLLQLSAKSLFKPERLLMMDPQKAFRPDRCPVPVQAMPPPPINSAPRVLVPPLTHPIIIAPGRSMGVEFQPQRVIGGPWWLGIYPSQGLTVTDFRIANEQILCAWGHVPAEMFAIEQSEWPEGLIGINGPTANLGHCIALTLHNRNAHTVQVALALWGSRGLDDNGRMLSDPRAGLSPATRQRIEREDRTTQDRIDRELAALQRARDLRAEALKEDDSRKAREAEERAKRDGEKAAEALAARVADAESHRDAQCPRCGSSTCRRWDYRLRQLDDRSATRAALEAAPPPNVETFFDEWQTPTDES